MAGIKYRYYSKLWESTCAMIKYLSMYKVWQEIAHHTVLCNTLQKTNDFPIAKAEAMLPLVELISEKKNSYTDASDRKDPTGIDEKML